MSRLSHVEGLESRVLLSGLPQPPSGVEATVVGTARVEISWTDNSDNELQFEITRATGDGPFELLVLNTLANTTRNIDLGVVTGTSYRYRVRAANLAGASEWSAPTGVLVTPPPPLAVPVTVAEDFGNHVAYGPQDPLLVANDGVRVFSMVRRGTTGEPVGIWLSDGTHAGSRRIVEESQVTSRVPTERITARWLVPTPGGLYFSVEVPDLRPHPKISLWYWNAATGAVDPVEMPFGALDRTTATPCLVGDRLVVMGGRFDGSPGTGCFVYDGTSLQSHVFTERSFDVGELRALPSGRVIASGIQPIVNSASVQRLVLSWDLSGNAPTTLITALSHEDEVQPRLGQPNGPDEVFIHLAFHTEMQYWRTDGTPEGTRRVDAGPMPIHRDAVLRNWGEIDGVHYFAVGHSVYRLEGDRVVLAIELPKPVAGVTPGTAFGVRDGDIFRFYLTGNLTSWYDAIAAVGTFDPRSGVAEASLLPGLSANHEAQLVFIRGRMFVRTDLGGVAAVDPLTRTYEPLTGISSVNPWQLGAVGDRLLIHRRYWYPSAGGVWSTDGSASGLQRLTRDGETVTPSRPDQLLHHQGRLYFTTLASISRDVWMVEGTSPPVRIFSGTVRSIVPLGDRVLILGGTDLLSGQLYVFDPGSGAMSSLSLNTQLSAMIPLATLAGRLVFASSNVGSTANVWVTDGTTAGTTRLGAAMLDVPTDPVLPKPWVQVGGSLYLATSKGLYRTDGQAMTQLTYFPTINAGHGLAAIGDAVYGIGQDSGAYVPTLYRIEPTGSLTPIRALHAASPPNILSACLTSAAGKLFFSWYDPAVGIEPWTSDGTAAGTRVIGDIVPGPSLWTEPYFLTPYRNGVAFLGQNLFSFNVYYTDGTAAGTYPIGSFSKAGSNTTWFMRAVGDFLVYGDGRSIFRATGLPGTPNANQIDSILSPFAQPPYPTFSRFAAIGGTDVYYSTDDDANGTRQLLKASFDPPAAPSLPSERGRGGHRDDVAVLRWIDRSSNESGYQVQRLDRATHQVLANWYLPADATSFTDPEAGAFDYRITAFNAGGGRSLLVDRHPPTAAFEAVPSSELPTGADEVTLRFSEAVLGFDVADLVLTRDGVPLATANLEIRFTDDRTAVVSGLSALTGRSGQYRLALDGSSTIRDAGGNPLTVPATVTWHAFRRGDVNGDDRIDNGDIAGMVILLTRPDAFSAAYPWVNPSLVGDVNRDGTLNNQDLAPFIALLTGSSPASSRPAPREAAPTFSRTGRGSAGPVFSSASLPLDSDTAPAAVLAETSPTRLARA